MRLAVNPFGYHRPGKYTIEKVKPSQAQPPLQRATKSLHTLFEHTGIFLNNVKKLKKMTEKTNNYFNPPSIFLEPPCNYLFNHFLGVLGLKDYPTESHSESRKINIRH